MKAATWDRPTRILHWLLALCVVLNLFVVEDGDTPHEWIGYLAVTVVLARFFWGFKGAAASRFQAFPIAPRSILAFIKAGFRSDHEGHNPLASIIYIVIWTLIIGIGLSGWMMGLDAYWGEDWVEDIHVQLSNALQAAIVVHLCGMTLDSIRYRRPTWAAMITGRKRLPTTNSDR